MKGAYLVVVLIFVIRLQETQSSDHLALGDSLNEFLSLV